MDALGPPGGSGNGRLYRLVDTEPADPQWDDDLKRLTSACAPRPGVYRVRFSILPVVGDVHRKRVSVHAPAVGSAATKH